MAERICINVSTPLGELDSYSIDVEMNIGKLIKYVAGTHKSIKNTDTSNVDWNASKLYYKNKALDHYKTLEEYPEFQYKMKAECEFKIILAYKAVDPSHTSTSTGPIIIKNHSNSKLSPEVAPPPSMSFPSTNSFLEKHLSRMDKRNKSHTLKTVSASLNDISEWIKDLSENTEPTDKMDKIIDLLQSMHTKLDKLIENTT